MAEKLLIAAERKVESDSPFMPKSLARAVTLFTAPERRKLIYQARMILRQPGLDVRGLISPHSHSRILIVTPRKVGTAPERNLVRRRLKAIFYEEKLYTQPYDLLIYCRKESVGLTYKELKDILIAAVSGLSNG